MTSTPPTPAGDSLPPPLARGYAAFRSGSLPNRREAFRKLSTEGQKPPVLLIGCCDSRVPPELVFAAEPGDLFVVRNIAALVPPFDPATRSETAAAIEYAVLALNVAHIVVMGHRQCGGIRAYAQGAQGARGAFEPLSPADFIAKWKALVAPAADRIDAPGADLDGYCAELECAAVAQGLANLRTYPFVREREDGGTLSLHGARFDIADGGLSVLDAGSGRFVPAAGPAA